MLVDDTHALVSSPNPTSTAGYSATTGTCQNEEVRVHVSADRPLLRTLSGDFERIRERAQALSDATTNAILLRSPTVGWEPPATGHNHRG